MTGLGWSEGREEEPKTQVEKLTRGNLCGGEDCGGVVEGLTPEGVRYRLAVIFYVNLIEHCGCGGVGVLVVGDFGGVLEGLAYVV